MIAAFDAKQMGYTMDVKYACCGVRRVFPEPLKLASFPVACSVNGVYQFLSGLCCVRCCLDIKNRAKAFQKKTALTRTPLFGCLNNTQTLLFLEIAWGIFLPCDLWKKRWFAEYEHSSPFTFYRGACTRRRGIR